MTSPWASAEGTVILLVERTLSPMTCKTSERRLPPVGVKSQEERGLEAAELRQASGGVVVRNRLGKRRN